MHLSNPTCQRLVQPMAHTDLQTHLRFIGKDSRGFLTEIRQETTTLVLSQTNTMGLSVDALSVK